jgi:GAF domain-containing protein
MQTSIIDSYFYALARVIEAVYRDEEDLSDVLYFIVSLAAELTAAKGATIRVLEQETFDLRLVSSCGLSRRYLNSGAIDLGKSVTEIMQGDTIIINDLQNDSRIQNRQAAREEGLNAVIGIPFTVNESTYSILRTYYASEKVPSHDEMELLYSLGKLSCLAIERTVVRDMR